MKRKDLSPLALRDSECRSISTPLYTINLSTNSSWFMINLINAAASQQLAFTIDSHDLWIVSADGQYVNPRMVQASYSTGALSTSLIFASLARVSILVLVSVMELCSNAHPRAEAATGFELQLSHSKCIKASHFLITITNAM